MPVLPATVAGGFIALGLVLLFAAAGIKIEFSGGSVADLQGTLRRVFVAVVGVGLLVWGFWSVLPKSYEITEVTITPQETEYSKPCPEKIPVLVAVHARAAPGEVHYVVYFEDQHGVPLHRGRIGKNGTSAYLVRATVPPGTQGTIDLTARTVYPNRKWAEAAMEFSC